MQLYREWKKSQPSDDEDPGETDVNEPVTTLAEAEETAWSIIREYLAQMPPYDFQELVAALLRAMEYPVDWVAPPGADGGVDVLYYSDPLGATGPCVKSK